MEAELTSDEVVRRGSAFTTRKARLRELGRQLASYGRDWVEFAEDHFGVDNDDWQRQVIWSVQENQKTAVAGAQSVGKDFAAAQCAAAKLILSPFCKVSVTSASGGSLFANFWGEISRLYRSSDLFQKFFEFQSHQIVARNGLGAEWFLQARLSSAHYSPGGKEKVAEGIAGTYAPGGTVSIADEASGIEDAVLDAIMGTQSDPSRKMLWIGNALRRTGRFHDVFRVRRFRQGWVLFNIPYTMSRRIMADPAAVAERELWKQQRGERSAYYLARALGEFPTAGTINTIVPEDLAALALSRDGVDPGPGSGVPLQLGLDMARFGDDLCVLIAFRWPVALSIDAFSLNRDKNVDSQFVLGLLHSRIREHLGLAKGADIPKNLLDEVSIRIDDGGGYGSGVIDPLVREGFRVAGVQNNAEASSSKARKAYENAATEYWDVDLLGALRRGACLKRIESDVLLSQLTSREYDYSKGRTPRMMLTSKEKMRAAGLGSPDHADALVLSLVDGRKLRYRGSYKNSIAIL